MSVTGPRALRRALSMPLATTDSPGGEASVLRRFLTLLMAAPPASRGSLFPRSAHEGVRATYFLLHRDPGEGPDVEGFVTHLLERILLQLTSRSERELIEYQGRVRGQIAWSATLKSRYTGDYDPTRYVCREVRRRYDTPENQLLKFTVERIWQCVRAVPPSIRSGACYYPDGGQQDSATIDDRLAALEAVLPRLRKQHQLRQITLPAAVTPEHIVRAQTSKLEEYGSVAELYERLHACVIAESWNGLARLGRESLPLPHRLDRETDPWIRLAASVLKAPASSG